MKIILKIDKDMFLSMAYTAHLAKDMIEKSPDIVIHLPFRSFILSSLAWRIDPNTLVRWKNREAYKRYQFAIFLDEVIAMYQQLMNQPDEYLDYDQRRLLTEFDQILKHLNFNTNQLIRL